MFYTKCPEFAVHHTQHFSVGNSFSDAQRSLVANGDWGFNSELTVCMVKIESSDYYSTPLEDFCGEWYNKIFMRVFIIECSMENGLGGMGGEWKKQLARDWHIQVPEVFKKWWGHWGGGTKYRLEMWPNSDVQVRAADFHNGVSSLSEKDAHSHGHTALQSEKYHQGMATFAG